RAYTKLKSTYVDKVKSLTIDGLVHPNYNHLFTSTGRLSSGKEDDENDSDINFQNFNKYANKEIRNMVKAPDGHVFVAIDYGQLEARCLAMASNDLEFSGAIWYGEDTHMRWTDRMIELYPPVLDYVKDKKELRNDNKSNLTFAIFYGASKYSVIDYYARTYRMPERIMEQIFEEFWDVYVGVKEWQEDTLRFYDKYGYVQSLTGRRRRMPMKKNEIINLPIQNTASFDICICAGNRISKLAYELNKPQYQYRLNIHDDLSYFIPKETFEDDVLFIAKEMVRPVYDFITVPLEVEISTGTNWGELKDLCKFNTSDFWEYKNNRWVEL
ncbi:MAG TPA: DNA polymerase, partial [Bacteroidales bacterium]|nr:DNA polymerase [Bacteroidales bacterium]